MSSLERKALSLSLRCYRVLLRVYPRAFRDEFESLLCQAFGDLSNRVLRSRGPLGWVVLWPQTIWDLLTSAIDQRFGNVSGRWLRLRWILACAVGLPLGAALPFVDLYTLSFISRTLSLAEACGFKRGDPVVFVFVVAFVVSFPLGWLQSETFGWKRTARFAWIATTVLGVTLGYTAMYSMFSRNYLWTTIAAYQPFVYPIGFLLCGLIIGLFQTTVLAPKTVRAWAWVPACAVSMLGVGYLTLATPMFLAPIVGGAMFGVLTAGALQWIVESPDLTSEGSAGVVSEKSPKCLPKRVADV